MATQKHQVTTGTAIEGWEIQKHLGVVASHAVAGAGLVSEFFASFSDIFGGRSGSYRKQLEALYNDTIDDLLKQAQARGGNWLVGLRIDLDEVSGKGTQMFMITGLATAVKAVPALTEGSGRNISDETVAADEVQAMMKRLALVQRMASPGYRPTDDEWEFIVSNRVVEVCPTVLALYGAALKNGDPSLEILRQRVLSLLAGIDRAAATAHLFNALLVTESAAGATDLLTRGGYGDMRAVQQLLRADDLDNRRRALQTLGASQPFYSHGDVAVIDDLIKAIPGAFPDRSKEVEKKGLLGGQKINWQCVCGNTNHAEAARCGTCTRDKAGFAETEMSPKQTVDGLHALRASLLAVLAK